MTHFRVILTHQHADFDALASLLGAWLLFPDAIPVLPTQLNRDVQAFVDEIAAQSNAEFPFVPHHEVPKGRVTQAVLVDTQRANPVKGMDEKTPHLVIDHHPLRDNLPDSWDLTIEKVGANATLLVERIRDEGIGVTTSQATLLALGIYQDTGRLTYQATSNRDAQAVAWLLADEHRADLQLINRFLRHPLSEAQQRLLNSLLANSNFITINQQVVAVAEARATDFDDPFSALIGRVQQTFDSDAVFLLIELVDRQPETFVQLIGRSRIERLDVGEIARYFGGNGHPRAAAASIHAQTIREVRLRLESLIEQQMINESMPNDPVTLAQDGSSEGNVEAPEARTNLALLPNNRAMVRHIMSVGRPRTLPELLTVERAMTLMRRYGHEGFPVITQAAAGREDRRLWVDDLLGLLTRRDADRAYDHEMLGEPVTRFMHQGAVTIRINDSLATLRRLMVQSGWGQIPVRSEENEIVGIVTRTDLLRAQVETASPHSNVAKQLANVLHPSRLALLQRLGQEAESIGYTLFAVGGFVRDMLLHQAELGQTQGISRIDRSGMDGPDVDIVMEGDAIHFAKIVQQSFGGRVVTHKQFGTAKWLLQDGENPVEWLYLANTLGLDAEAELSAVLPDHLDFVTARTEYYGAPSALPTVETGSIQLDLRRRDFTINTLAICLNPPRWGQLLDFFGGETDLHNGYIRILHSLSFVDDPTRILRAIRYQQRFDFSLQGHTKELLIDSLTLIDRLTPVRIRHELDRIFQEARPEQVLDRLDKMGILQSIHRDLRYSIELGEYFAKVCHYHSYHSVHRADYHIEHVSKSSREESEDEQSDIGKTNSISEPVGDTSPRSSTDLTGSLATYPTLKRILCEEPLSSLYWILLLFSSNAVSQLNPKGGVRQLINEESKANQALFTRLAVPNRHQQIVTDLHMLSTHLNHLRQNAHRPSQIVQILDPLNPVALALGGCIESNVSCLEIIEAYLRTWRHATPMLNGHDLMNLGIPRGPQIREVLAALRIARLDNLLKTKDDEVQFTEEWQQNLKGNE
ncbi:MAG: CBS domain-containing protein [Chloroflexota bacterium]